jgi:hypothetical protein
LGGTRTLKKERGRVSSRGGSVGETDGRIWSTSDALFQGCAGKETAGSSLAALLFTLEAVSLTSGVFPPYSFVESGDIKGFGITVSDLTLF